MNETYPESSKGTNLIGIYQVSEEPFFKDTAIKFEAIYHSVIKEAGVAGAAQAINCPKEYIVTTELFDCGGKTIGVFSGGEAKVDPAAVAAAVGSADAKKIEGADAERITGIKKLDISPATLWKKIDCIWDEKLFDYPYLIFAKTGTESSIKIDTREFSNAGFASADVTSDSERTSAYDALLERGFIDRITDEDLARKVMSDNSVRGYIGFDPTADSLHVGSLVPIMALANIQKRGMRPIAIVGGGTALVGDPSGKTEMRKMLSDEQIRLNMKGISNQLSNYVRFDDDGALLLNNADWLVGLSYIEFLREVGVHFSVNRMIKAECFATRLEKGLSFIEFNYMLMQAYDFVHLAEKYNCLVQLGGSDQWGNIIAGKDLGHRATGSSLFGTRVEKSARTVGVTFPLLKNASGTKFGKTEGGNVWLDAAKSTVYEFFQFWRNADDADIRRIMGLFTFIPMKEVRALTARKTGTELNLAKEVTAFATTALLHGQDGALSAAATAKSRFGGYGQDFVDKIIALDLADKNKAEDFAAGKINASSADDSSASAGLPTVSIAAAAISEGVAVTQILVDLGFVQSNGEAKRMIKQNAVSINGNMISSLDEKLPSAAVGDEVNIKMGKKKFGVVKVI